MFLFLLQKKSIELNATKIPIGDAYFRCSRLNSNSCSNMIYYHQIGESTHRNNVLTALLSDIISKTIDDTLCWDELAYSAFSEVHDTCGTVGYSIKVNFDEIKIPIDEIDDRIQIFRQKLISVIKEMPDDDFEKFKLSLIKLKSSIDDVLSYEACRNWREIIQNAYVFDRSEREVEILKTITKADLFEFYLKYLNDENRKLSIQLIKAADTEDQKIDELSLDIENMPFVVDFNTPKPNTHLIQDIAEFKRGLELYPAYQNVEN